jgi:sterol desaturase/sphingolipid hydroxylase (fatty acid hydroxylase superfamily)
MVSTFVIKQAWIIVAFAAIFTFEHLAPFYRRRGTLWPHDLRNLVVGIINVGITTLLFSSLTVYLAERFSGTQVGLLRAIDLPRGIEVAIAIVSLDLYIYWWHRLNHRVGFLWLFHRVHHSDPGVDVSSSYRFHIVEVGLSLVGRLAFITLLGIDAFPVFLFEMIFSPIVYFHHSNIRISEKADRFIRVLFPSPHMHRVHHSVKPKETDSNYGSVFSLWDRLFRSFRLINDPRLIKQGLNEFTDASHHTIIGMLKTPFLRLPR